MSNVLREIVELTFIGDPKRGSAQNAMMKSVLLHVADTVRNNDLRFFRSKHNTALRIGCDVKTVRRRLSDLVDLGILEDGGFKKYTIGIVDVYVVNVNAILALPSIEECDRRHEFAAKLKPSEVGTDSPEGGPYSPGVGTQSPPNHKEPYLTNDLLGKQNIHVVQSAREELIDDHLADDPKYKTWLAAKKSRHG